MKLSNNVALIRPFAFGLLCEITTAFQIEISVSIRLNRLEISNQEDIDYGNLYYR